MKFLCFEITYIGFNSLNQPWKAFAESGDRLNAVKGLRKVRNFNIDHNDPNFLSLREAVAIVDKYTKKHKK
jgi:hypothetical protein